MSSDRAAACRHYFAHPTVTEDRQFVTEQLQLPAHSACESWISRYQSAVVETCDGGYKNTFTDFVTTQITGQEQKLKVPVYRNKKIVPSRNTI